MAVSADLESLVTLYNVLKNDVDSAHTIISETDTALNNAQWESPNAESFRTAWTEFRPNLIRMEMACADAACDVASNHNNIALANGVSDAPELTQVQSLDVI